MQEVYAQNKQLLRENEIIKQVIHPLNKLPLNKPEETLLQLRPTLGSKPEYDDLAVFYEVNIKFPCDIIMCISNYINPFFNLLFSELNPDLVVKWKSFNLLYYYPASL